MTSVVAEVVLCEKRPTSRKGLEIVTAFLSDGQDSLNLKAVWFNMPRIADVLLPGVRVALYGKVEMRGGLQLLNPELEVLDESDPQSVGRIVSVYPATAGLSPKWVRRIVSTALEACLAEVQDFLPPGIRQKYDLADLQGAVMELHRPQGRESWKKARDRLAFDELFLLQTGLLLRKKQRESIFFPSGENPENSGKTAQAVKIALTPGETFHSFLRALPFPLTGAQRRVIQEITADLASKKPMNRLLQGDVGSGKTIVAAAALVIAADSGAQGAFMVPTEILAQQHFFRLRAILSDLGVKVDLLTGSLSASARRQALEAIASGESRIVVGTHAIFSKKVTFRRLEMVVVDEQHRFGVLQKNALLAKARSPHVLVMTATPIPRTLTLSIYGDLDVSVLDELPAGRKPVQTYRMSLARSGRQLLEFIRDAVRQGRQAYWVCPLIEESEKKMDLTAAYSRFESLKEWLPGLRAAMIHGQMPAEEKEAVMASFEGGEVDLLVATSVIEVGLDVPNATVMVIEDADHFGVAQLHQLRGRVGRGSEESYCVLLTGKSTPEGVARINALLSTSDGFKIAEMDLRQRGPGEICGVRQHGITDFRVANLVYDRKLLELARREAALLIEKDPGLESARPLAGAVMSRLGAALDLAGTA